MPILKSMQNKLTVLIFLIISTISVHASTIEVCNSCKFKSIKTAIEYAKPFDTIIVQNGIYPTTNIIIQKPLTIIGKAMPTLDGLLKGDIFKIQANEVTIKGFNIINVGKDFANSNTAIRIQKSKNFNISNNQFKNVLYAIYLEKSSHGKVVNNKIFGNAVSEINSGNGIHIWDSSNVQITNNYIEKVRDGIYLEFAKNCTIAKNISTQNLRYGLHFMFSNNNVYTHNKFINNGAGVAVMFSKKIDMHHNVFMKNWGSASYGLLLKEINDADIKNNIFEENTIAINVEGSNRINYSKNNFIRNGWALKVRGACYNNIFESNNFISNSFDVSWNTKMNDNKFSNNFWSAYAGYDIDKDGVGDVPYRPVKLFSYIVNKTPETIILLRSLFINLIDFSEKVTPVFTPDFLIDNQPKMKPVL